MVEPGVEAELARSRAGADGLNRLIDEAILKIRSSTNPGALLNNAPAAPNIVLPSLTINLAAQAEQLAASFSAIVEGRLGADLAAMQRTIDRFISGQRFSAAQMAGAASVNS